MFKFLFDAVFYQDTMWHTVAQTQTWQQCRFISHTVHFGSGSDKSTHLLSYINDWGKQGLSFVSAEEESEYGHVHFISRV